MCLQLALILALIVTRNRAFYFFQVWCFSELILAFCLRGTWVHYIRARNKAQSQFNQDLPPGTLVNITAPAEIENRLGL